MDVQAMASQLIGFLGENPNLISQFVKHPYSTTAEATGTEEQISQTDMSQIVTQVASQVTGQSFGSGDLGSIASTLLSQNGGSVHELTGSLFGGLTSLGNLGDLGNLGNLGDLGNLTSFLPKR